MSKFVFVLDYDGTLINNTKAHFQKMNLALSSMGLKPVDEVFLQKVWGDRFVNIVKLLLEESTGETPSASLIHDFIYHEKQVPQEEARIDEELLEALKSVKADGHYLTILTNRTRDSLLEETKKIWEKLGIFDLIQTSDQSQFHKPDGKVFRGVFSFAKVKEVDKIMYFGDTVYDWAAAETAEEKVTFVGVVSGATKVSEFYKLGVSEVLDIKGISEYLNQRIYLNI